jgi:hypothetical protein
MCLESTVHPSALAAARPVVRSAVNQVLLRKRDEFPGGSLEVLVEPFFKILSTSPTLAGTNYSWIAFSFPLWILVE